MLTVGLVVAGDACTPVCGVGFFDGGTTATGFAMLCREDGSYALPAADATLVCTACHSMDVSIAKHPSLFLILILS